MRTTFEERGDAGCNLGRIEGRFGGNGASFLPLALHCGENIRMFSEKPGIPHIWIRRPGVYRTASIYFRNFW